MDDMSVRDDNEIDLRELFSAVFAHKKVIVTSLLLALALSVVVALTRDKIYEAETIFELQSAASGPQIPAQYAGFASLAGVSLGKSKDTTLFDRLQARDFIVDLAETQDLLHDPYFAPQEASSGLLSMLRNLFLGSAGQEDTPDPIENVVTNYRDNVSASETRNGSVSVKVQHEDPLRAAELANAIVVHASDELAFEKKQEQKEQLAYLTNQLADALTEMDASKKAVADFALTNSLASKSAFAKRSEMMFSLREDLLRGHEMLDAIDAIKLVVTANKTPSDQDYQNLRMEAPVIDDVEFRRLVGIPEALDAWQWPPEVRLGSFSRTLSDRIARIERSIRELQQEAERYAASAEELTDLERKAKIAEAAYNVLIEQVKAQALLSGYQGKLVNIYQVASPPVLPVSPNRKLIVALGGVLGLMIGAAVASGLWLRGGRVYSFGALSEATKAAVTFSDARLRKLMKAPMDQLDKFEAKFKGERSSELLVALKTRGSSLTLLGATDSTIRPLPFAYWLARRFVAQNRRAAVLLLDAGATKLPEGTPLLQEPRLCQREIDGVSVLTASPGLTLDDILMSDAIETLLAGETAGFEHVILAASDSALMATARAQVARAPYVIVLTKPAYTRRSLLSSLTSVCSIDANVSLV